jgi:ketosteroid isomerase-like protein
MSLDDNTRLYRPADRGGGAVNGEHGVPALRQVVLDGTDIRTLAEFYRRLLGLRYRPGDEPPASGRPFCIFVAAPPTDGLARFMDAYTEAWNAGDLDGIVTAYATPCYVVKGGRVLRYEDEAAKARYFGDLLAGHRREGPHTWSIGRLDRRPLGSDAAMVTVRWHCRRPDGSTIWDFLDSYLLASEQGRWQILGDVVHG